jgi:ketosteroid isomerase-like protein
VLTIAGDDPRARAVVEAVHAGAIDELERLLAASPGLAAARLGDAVEGITRAGISRSLLHVVTDWPGHHPNGAAAVALLVAAGADVNARFAGPHTETPLHWAASSDDVEVLDALLDAGADIEATGAVIGGGTPLADAVAFGQWRAARRLVERGARANLWQAAALGMMDRVHDCLATEDPSAQEITSAFWLACHGGQRPAAELLLERGADLDWVGYDDLTALDAAARSEAHEVVRWLEERGARSARDPGVAPPSRPSSDLELFVAEWLTALARCDLDAAAALVDPEVVWQGIREDFVCRGRAQVLDMLRGTLRHRPRPTALEVVAGEGAVVFGVLSPDLTEIGGVPTGGRLFSVYRIRAGRIVAVEDHLDRDEALRAAGAPAPGWG